MPQPDFTLLRDSEGQAMEFVPMQDQITESVRRVLLERATVHDYTAADVNRTVVISALEAAVAAPNHRMTEPWRFTLVGRESRRRLVDLAVQLKTTAGADVAALREKLSQKMLNPAYLVVVSQRLAAEPEVRKEDYAAISCAIQNFMLALWNVGVGSKWGTGAVTRHADAYSHLGIAGDLEEIVGFIWVGVPARVPSKARRRCPLTDVVRELP